MNDKSLWRGRTACAGIGLVLAFAVGSSGCSASADAPPPWGEERSSGAGPSGASDCVRGERSCACDEGASCKPGLACEGGLCRATQGADGQDCYPNATCDEGLSCRDGKCVACAVGERGCACRSDAVCDGVLVCNNGRCVTPEGIVSRRVPDAPKCYSPCTAPLELPSGEVIDCPSDGYMAACLGGRMCREGSCLLPNEAPPTCVSDIQCPEFQACIGGRCYSDCESHEDCTDGVSKCDAHVCRKPCRATDPNACGPNETCHTSEGNFGYCRAIPGSDAPPSTRVEGAFTVTPGTSLLSNAKLDDTVTLVNQGPRGVRFTVKKLRHYEFVNGETREVTQSPAPFLRMGRRGALGAHASFEVVVDGGGGSASFDVAVLPSGALPATFQVDLEISAPGYPTQLHRVSYAAGTAGRWVGKMYRFAQFGEANLDSWMQSRADGARLAQVGNALVQRWGAFRQGRIGLPEVQAVFAATIHDTWRSPSLKSICPTYACYFFSRTTDASTTDPGFRVYSSSRDVPVPTGVTELPVAFDLDADGTSSGRRLIGRIASRESLQYAANPELELEFDTDANVCPPADPDPSRRRPCVVPMKSLSATVAVGGRFRATADTDCARGGEPSGFSMTKQPWLVRGFVAGTSLDEATGVRYAHECREIVTPHTNVDAAARNASLAAANPIPDGRARRRTLSLVDGALVNQETMVAIVKESFGAEFLGAGTDPFASYALVLLDRSRANIPSPLEKQAPPPARASAVDVESPLSCSPALVSRLLGQGAVLNASTPDAAVRALAHGVLAGAVPMANPAPYPAADVHYLCHDTGKFDGAAACPWGSGTTFFVSKVASLDAHACNATGSCQAELDRLVETGAATRQVVYRCQSDADVSCERNRRDLRAERIFFPPTTGGVVFGRLLSDIDTAFRYKTRFANRQGRNVGFAPQVCVSGSNAVPYCYAPDEIESVRDRVDCAVTLFSRHAQKLDAPTLEALRTYLETNFSYRQERDPTLPRPVIRDGFERLYAELLVMLGDESYTKAFQSRFDVAGSGMVSFEGSRFEPGGIDLSGVAGFELHSLYQASQYYQTALDRFYTMAPALSRSIVAVTGPRAFTRQETLAYLEKIVRASSQKSRAVGEIAKRYQTLNRPDLARAVVERGYTGAHLESIVVSRMLRSLETVSTPETRDQIARSLESAQTTYRAALTLMRDIYSALTDDLNYFGFAADYVPFPVVESHGNAFEVALSTAKQALAMAKEKEEVAIASNRSYEVDAASFQAEITRLRNSYERELGVLCGTFRGKDGRIYPATRTYADMDEKAKLFGDPCGFMGNGAIHDAIVGLQRGRLDVESVETALKRGLDEIEIERRRVQSLCSTLDVYDAKRVEKGRAVNRLRDQIADANKAITQLKMARESLGVIAQLAACVVGTATDCPSKLVQSAVYAIGAMAIGGQIASSESVIADKEKQIRDVQIESIRVNGELEQCALAKVDSEARVATMSLRLAELDLEAAKVGLAIKQAAATIDALRNQATRLFAEQTETQSLAIDVESAKNDPNVRIYKNDAVLNADRTFYAALREAYKATRVFEYYTSQSYAKVQTLSIVRLVSRGDFSLESYLAELEDAYGTFRETYGKPDVRVEVLSLREHVFRIPKYDASGNILTDAERHRLFRERLREPTLLDARGYLTVPFSTSLARLSPLTRNHKILYVEGAIEGAPGADGLGRLYLRQSGTAMVAPLQGLTRYFRFPERTAVINPFFGGTKLYGPETYRSERLRDRPFANSYWELVFNQRDEAVNQDVDLNRVTDMRLFVYYTDFTAL